MYILFLYYCKYERKRPRLPQLFILFIQLIIKNNDQDGRRRICCCRAKFLLCIFIDDSHQQTGDTTKTHKPSNPPEPFNNNKAN